MADCWGIRGRGTRMRPAVPSAWRRALPRVVMAKTAAAALAASRPRSRSKSKSKSMSRGGGGMWLWRTKASSHGQEEEKGRSGQSGLRDASGVIQQTGNFPDSGHGQRRKERSRWPIRSSLSGWPRVAQGLWGLWGLRDDVCGGLARAQSRSPRQAPPDPFRPSRCHFQHEASLGNPLMHAHCPAVAAKTCHLKGPQSRKATAATWDERTCDVTSARRIHPPHGQQQRVCSSQQPTNRAHLGSHALRCPKKPNTCGRKNVNVDETKCLPI